MLAIKLGEGNGGIGRILKRQGCCAVGMTISIGPFELEFSKPRTGGRQIGGRLHRRRLEQQSKNDPNDADAPKICAEGCHRVIVTVVQRARNMPTEILKW